MENISFDLYRSRQKIFKVISYDSDKKTLLVESKEHGACNVLIPEWVSEMLESLLIH